MAEKIRNRCTTCGTWFETDAAWKRTCLPCWKAGKNARPGYDLTKALETQLRATQAALRAAEVPAEILRLLVQLCHPDRHGNSPASQRATQWINERRKATR